MKSYTITVNGQTYDVTVEEKVMSSVSGSESVKKIPPVNPTTSAAPAKATGTGRIKVRSGAAGKVSKIDVKVGQRLGAGDRIAVVEAMKMEIPVVTPEEGMVASIDVAVGDTVENGAILATLK